MLTTILKEYSEAIFDTDSDRALQVVHNAYENGVSAEDIVFGVVIPSIEQFLTALIANQE